jgi:CMP/dCMP kinase
VTYSVTGPNPVAAGAAEDAEPAANRCVSGSQPGADGLAGHRVGLVVAVDGPSGSGKSSAARGTAVALGLRYLDTGAMYRAVTWWLLANGVDAADRTAVTERLPGIVVDISTDPGAQAVRVNGTDVTAEVRTRQVSNAVSLVASIPQVRSQLIGQQQQIIGAVLTAGAGIVAEGRDIGTVVAPDATVKVFLTASEEARARRRAAELARLAAHERHEQAEGTSTRPVADAGAGLAAPTAAAVPDQVPTAEVTRLEQARRDRRDAPQSQRAADAIEIDATDLGLDDVIGLIVSLATRQAGTGWTS